MIQLLLNKTTPPFQLLPMPKVDIVLITHSRGGAFTVSEKSSNMYTLRFLLKHTNVIFIYPSS